MATEKQIAANRANGAKGGPKTQEGKERCKMNALKHGLSCKTAIIMKGEDIEEFKAIYHQFFSSFRPVSGAEQQLVQRLTNAQWKGNRKEHVEAGLLDWHVVKERYYVKQDCDKMKTPMPEGTEPARFIGLSFTHADPHMDRFLRYAAAIDREFHKTLSELIALVKLRHLLYSDDSETVADPQAPTPAAVTAAPVFAMTALPTVAAACVPPPAAEVGPPQPSPDQMQPAATETPATAERPSVDAGPLAPSPQPASPLPPSAHRRDRSLI